MKSKNYILIRQKQSVLFMTRILEIINGILYTYGTIGTLYTSESREHISSVSI